MIAGLVTLIIAVVAVALASDDGGTPAPQVDQSPAVTAPEPGPAAPLPGPLERALRDLERLVQQ